MTNVVDKNGDIQGASAQLSAVHQSKSIHGLKIIPGGYYAAGGVGCIILQSASGVVIPAATVRFLPFLPPVSGMYSSIAMYVVLGDAIGNINMGLYDSDASGLPTGNPITGTMSGSVNVPTSTTVIEYTFTNPIYLKNTKLYYAAYATDSVVATFASCASSSSPASCGGFQAFLGENAVSNTQSNIAGYNQTFVFSATLPTVGSLTNYAPGLAVSFPFIMLRAAT